MIDTERLRDVIRRNLPNGHILGHTAPSARLQTVPQPDLIALLEVAQSTLPKRKVETAYYVTVFRKDRPMSQSSEERFTSLIDVEIKVRAALLDGCSLSISPPRQEEVPA